MLFIKWAGPYGPEYLDVWIQKGNLIIESLEEYRKVHNAYPDSLPEVNISDIPGCRDIEYHRFVDADNSEYFVLRLSIHMREAVVYDSRKNLNESTSWGNCVISKDWMWTKD